MYISLASSMGLFARQALTRINPSHYSPGQRQSDQFRICRKLYSFGLARVEDPLFECTVNPSKHNKSSKCDVSFVYRGLRVKGLASQTQLVELFLNDFLIKKDRIDSGHNREFYWIYLNRPVITAFPKDSQLRVRLTDQTSRKILCEEEFVLSIPHGTEEIFQRVDTVGMIDKKGDLPLAPQEFLKKQEDLLLLYERVNRVFINLFNKPLFLMYGTLLGLYRDGDFIPGDDDFDVGFVSAHTDPARVKDEAKEMIRRLAGEGFTIALNRKGKPFRINDGTNGPSLHLDACPIWAQDGMVWTNPFGCLPISLREFESVEQRSFRGRDVLIPTGSETFLEAYYGDTWRVPDPDYSLSRPLPESNKKNLLRVCLTPKEVLKLQSLIYNDEQSNNGGGNLHSKAVLSLYPLDRYEKICGWE